MLEASSASCAQGHCTPGGSLSCPHGSSHREQDIKSAQTGFLFLPIPYTDPFPATLCNKPYKAAYFFLQVKAKRDHDLLPTACFNTRHLGPVIQGDSEAIPSPLELAGRVPPVSSEQHRMSQGRSQQEFCHRSGL